MTFTARFIIPLPRGRDLTIHTECVSLKYTRYKQWLKDKRKTMIFKTLHTKHKIELHEPHSVCVCVCVCGVVWCGVVCVCVCVCVCVFQFHIRRGEALATYVLVLVCNLELLYFYDSDHIILVPFYCIYN
jgi:hypothetical protein